MNKANITFYSHGACREVTGSKHFLEVDGKKLQIDAGMFQGKREASYLKNRDLPFSPAEVEAILLTHGHFDHAGALPLMVKHGFRGDIHATHATRDIANIIMQDSAHIQKKDYEYLLEKIAKRPERKLKAYEPLYGIADVLATLEQFVTVSYNRPFTPLPNVRAWFLDAGHILGSAMIRLSVADKVNIGFSGDLGRKNLPIIRDPEIMPPLDYLVLESTYGARLHESVDQAESLLEEVVLRAANRGGKVIIPAFSVERTQELIYILHQLTLEKRIPAIPIFVDSPMAINATNVFRLHGECFDKESHMSFLSAHLDPFGFENIKYTIGVNESKEINNVKGSAIIISASGMAETGRILHHLRNNIEDPRNIIAIVGFMAADTLGRKLVEKAPSIKIFGKEYAVKAEIKTLNAFSAHADYNEIQEWLGHSDLKRLKKIFLVHGEPEAQDNLKRELLKMGVSAVEIAEYGIQYPLEY